jgi:hypothetical protein
LREGRDCIRDTASGESLCDRGKRRRRFELLKDQLDTLLTHLVGRLIHCPQV